MVAPLEESLIPNPPPPEPLAFEFGGIRVRLDFRRVRRDLSRGEVTLYLNGTTLSDVRTSATPAIICQVNPALASPFVKEWQVWQVGDVGVGIARVTPEGVDDVVVGEGGEGLLRRSERGVEGMWREWRERRGELLLLVVMVLVMMMVLLPMLMLLLLLLLTPWWTFTFFVCPHSCGRTRQERGRGVGDGCVHGGR